MENNKNKKSVKFQGDMLNVYDFIQVFVFTTNHHLNAARLSVSPSEKNENLIVFSYPWPPYLLLGTTYNKTYVRKNYFFSQLCM